jgi:hypothetical protein
LKSKVAPPITSGDQRSTGINSDTAGIDALPSNVQYRMPDQRFDPGGYAVNNTSPRCSSPPSRIDLES